jgi:chromosome segregation ATPase
VIRVRFVIPLLLTLASLTLAAPEAWAQVSRGGGGVSAQMMQQYQQLAAERTQLQDENAQLKKERDDLKQKLDLADKDLAGAKTGAARNAAALSELAAARSRNEATEKSLADEKARLQELVDKFRETIANLRESESARTQLQQQVATDSTTFDRCVERNDALFQVTTEVLDRYEHQGAFSYMARAEPFTRLARTRAENLVEEYRERAEELRMQKAKAAPGGGGASGTPARGPTVKPAPAPASGTADPPRG